MGNKLEEAGSVGKGKVVRMGVINSFANEWTVEPQGGCLLSLVPGFPVRKEPGCDVVWFSNFSGTALDWGSVEGLLATCVLSHHALSSPS